MDEIDSPVCLLSVLALAVQSVQARAQFVSTAVLSVPPATVTEVCGYMNMCVPCCAGDTYKSIGRAVYAGAM